MSAIRFIGAIALAGTLAGCAGTKNVGIGGSAGIGDAGTRDTSTGAASTKAAAKTKPVPVKTVKKAAPPTVAPKVSKAVSDLPERVAALPRYTPVPVTPAPAPVVVQSVPSPSAPPLPQYIPEPVAEPTYEPVETAVTPRYEPVETVTEPSYEPVKTVAEPTYEPVKTAAAIPAPVADPARYTSQGSLDARPAPAPVAAPRPEPAYVKAAPKKSAPLTRSMSPIRDDPQDGNNGRRASNAEIRQHANKGYRRNAALNAGGPKPKVRSNFTPAFGMKLESAALARLNPRVRYDARYVKIGYPWGDVDESTGVCSDVIIRSYRKLGIDLQSLIHEDMKRAFQAYPSQRIYGLKQADPNIDHRRVVNMEAFFERTGASIPIGTSPDDFLPGDVLTWRLSGNEPHVGIVVSDRDPRSGFPLVVHNLGAGVRKEDLITLSPPVGHFRFAPDTDTVVASLRR